MKFLVTLIWSLGLGQIIAFLGARLVNVDGNQGMAAVVSVFFAVFMLFLEHIALDNRKEQD